MKTNVMRLRLIVCFLAAHSFPGDALCAEQTYVREYIYQASEADSKVSARAIALQEVKRELLSELGTHVSSLVTQQHSSDGKNLDSEQIETLSAGVTRVEILEEKWDGKVYVLKAQIKADPEDVLKSLNKMLEADKKQQQLTQLNGDLSKVQAEKIQIAQSLAQSRKEADAALAEIARLKKELEKKQSASQQTLQASYNQQVDQLSQNEEYVTAIKLYQAKDYPAAFQIFKKLASQGLAGAQTDLGHMYAQGYGVPRDYKQAAYWYQKAADQGNANAQVLLGYMYRDGTGVQKDEVKAFSWHEKAAIQGLAYGQLSLGLMYSLGLGVQKNEVKAAEWYEKAALQGDADAQVLLGYMYRDGSGVQKDYAKAFEWFGKAALQEHAEAQDQLGRKYRDEVAPLKGDYAKAIAWFEKAALQGHAGAQNDLGLMYSYGLGVPKSATKAAEWTEKAAIQGDANAQSNLGMMYQYGEGVKKDFVLSYAWLNLAAARGWPLASESRNSISLTASQRAEAEWLSSTWKPGVVLRRRGK
jgi:TPR repeat protein